MTPDTPHPGGGSSASPIDAAPIDATPIDPAPPGALFATGPAARPDQTSRARIASLDLIRGIAVIGILWANIVGYARPALAYRWAAALDDPGPADAAIWLFQYVFIDGKLRGLFALLLGAGLVLFMERARAGGAQAEWLQARRLFWLALFGLAHFFLLFRGDILFHYAALALAAMWVVVRWPPALLMTTGVFVFCIASVLSTVEMAGYLTWERNALTAPAGSGLRTAYESQLAAFRAEALAESVLMREGSLAAIVAHRLANDAHLPLANLTFMAFDSLPLMLIGAALFRLGLFSGGFRRAAMLGWGAAGIALSALLSAALGLWVIDEDFSLAANTFAFYGPTQAVRLPMILGYAAVLAALAPRLAPTAFGQRLAAAGRMAFTNYLGTSLLMAAIFQGWGLGLFDRFSRVELLGFVTLGAGLMLLCSKPWLERFRYGPLEWLWRCLTYWRLFPLRREIRAGRKSGAGR